MQIGRVVKKVVSTVKNHVYEGRPLLLVQPVNMALHPSGSEVLCIDFIGADIYELVLIMKEGSSVQQLLDEKEAPADAAIVGVVDSVHLENVCIFDKSSEVVS